MQHPSDLLSNILNYRRLQYDHRVARVDGWMDHAWHTQVLTALSVCTLPAYRPYAWTVPVLYQGAYISMTEISGPFLSVRFSRGGPLLSVRFSRIYVGY
jgi:hypothetical protein